MPIILFSTFLEDKKGIMTDFWNHFTMDWEDILKVCLAMLAGVILGVERELKDKSAGFKTIAIICVGSTLFTILSYKMGSGTTEDSTRIASYVVSGIGFLGAGVIFKEGGSVSGLTTASIIWISAAIGMAIGFGEYLTALIFLLTCILIIFMGPVINRYFVSNVAKTFEIKLSTGNLALKNELKSEMKKLSVSVKQKSMHVDQHGISISYDVVIAKRKLHALEELLLHYQELEFYTY